MAGRPKKPIELVVMEGRKHLTKEEIDRRKKEEIKAPADKIEAPSYLTAALKKRFNSIALELIEIGILTNLDTDALGRYVYAEYMHQQTTKKLRKLDMIENIVEFEKLTKIQDRYNKQARAAATDLGLTISSRVKLVVPKKEEPETPKTPEEKLFGGSL
ncbi:phage terminase small subunit P27 family [Enterococcus sp. BWM-S5]|uniref:Phage terminase small subunit P27 family n=1 Tax=Enterococcus larvae TaxID=2794352 RepID=A0ABS4CEM3_9ENTE|nr:phage terminase small subunit P27 family [Enterococcus larvae]MBP1044855.1 phage terminase small subunit P27 family [Enterococcus larvae]